MNKILTIIIPAYNISQYINQCVPYYLNHFIEENVDIFFIDDGATDNTKDVLAPYISSHPNFLHFVHKENGGHGSVINYGVFKFTKTKYFKIIDGDDWIDVDGLIEVIKILKKVETDVVFTDYKISINNLITHIKTSDFQSGFYKPKDLNYFESNFYSVIFRTDLFIKNNISLPEKIFYEDSLFCVLPFMYVRDFYYLNVPVYVYRLGNQNQSVSIQSMTKHIEDLMLVNDKMFLFYCQVNSVDYLEEFVGKNLIGNLRQEFLLIIQKYRNNKECKKKIVIFRERFFSDYPYLEKRLMSICKAYKYLKCLHFNFISLFRFLLKRRF